MKKSKVPTRIAKGESSSESALLLTVTDSSGDVLRVEIAEDELAATENLKNQKWFRDLGDDSRLIFERVSIEEILTKHAEKLEIYKPKFNYVLPNFAHFPFLVVTAKEKFPRLLVTRKPEQINENYSLFGAFLPENSVRRLSDLINRIFRLRPCTLDIRGDWEIPCPEFYRHRCSAPCVASICDEDTYAKAVERVKMLLAKDFASLFASLEKEIETLAADLEFEKAAKLRDSLIVLQLIETQNKWNLSTASMSDVLTIERRKNSITLNLNVLRRGKFVGARRFELESKQSSSSESDNLLIDFTTQFYRFHAPKEIFVSEDFKDKPFLEKCLSAKFKRKIKVTQSSTPNVPISVEKTQKNAGVVFIHQRQNAVKMYEDNHAEWRKLFNLTDLPRRVECFDVAHLGGEDIIAARVAAIDGEIKADEAMIWEFENISEIDALAFSVAERLKLISAEMPDAIILDGSLAHLNRTSQVLKELKLDSVLLIAATKPPKRHDKIAFFLANDRKILFDSASPLMLFLQNLRDAAHNLANQVHRESHSAKILFKKGSHNSVSPLVKHFLVPTAFAVSGGEADHLSPLASLKQSGELLVRSKEKDKSNSAATLPKNRL